MTSPIVKVIAGLILLTFVGIKYDTEFYEPELFIKHKPSLQFEYYSPTGDSDLTLDDLSGDRKEQEMAYLEFVGDYYERDFFDHISPLLIPLMSLLILTGLAQLVGVIKRKDSWRTLLLSYIANLLWLFVMFAIYWNLGLNGLLAIVTYWILSLLSIVLINTKMKPKRNMAQNAMS